MQNYLGNRCRKCSLQKKHSLLVAKFSRYSFQKFARFKKSLVTWWKFGSLLVAEVARCENHAFPVPKFARYLLKKLLVAKNHSLLVAGCRSLKNTYSVDYLRTAASEIPKFKLAKWRLIGIIFLWEVPHCDKYWDRTIVRRSFFKEIYIFNWYVALGWVWRAYEYLSWWGNLSRKIILIKRHFARLIFGIISPLVDSGLPLPDKYSHEIWKPKSLYI